MMGVSFSWANSAQKSENPNVEREEEVKERRDIHKPGQMSEGYDRHEDDEQQQDVTPDDSDPQFDPIDDDPEGNEQGMQGYPIK